MEATPIRAVVVDDESETREEVCRLVGSADDLEIVAECATGGTALDAIVGEHPDLVILDLQMPGMDGFDVLEGLNGRSKPAFLFLTEADDEVVRLLDAYAANFLRKPIDAAAFAATLERVGRQAVLGDPEREERLCAVLTEHRGQGRFAERFAVRSDGGIVFVRSDEIEWIEAAGNYVRLHLGDQFRTVRGTISGMEKRLDPTCFVRVHRSAIVNLDFVEEIRPWFHGEYVIVMRSGARVNLSRTYRQRMRRLIDAFS